MKHNALRTLTLKDPSKDEILLLEGLRANSELSFHRLYRDYSSALLGIILRIVKQEEQAEDVLQETFINISRNILLYNSEKSRFFTWMAKVATNRALDYIRSAPVRWEQNRVKFVFLEQDYFNESHISCLNVEAIGIKELTSILKSTEWQVIDLLYFQGYTQTEVAEELAIPLGTVKTKARMAILELRKQFIRARVE